MSFESSAEPRSAAERAYLALRAAILRGDLAPGERLRPAALHARLDAGLTPIREALTRLDVEGLVQGEAQRGFRVCGASEAEFADLMATRRELERRCLELAIARGVAAWEAEIVAAMHLLSRTPMPASQDDGSAAELWEARHRAFHLALVSACGSPWRLRFWHTLADHSERYRKIRLLRRGEAAAGVRDLNAEHLEIMRAVLARDAAAAAALMDAHLRATEQAIGALLFDANAPAD